jgi:hypothetical protein
MYTEHFVIRKSDKKVKYSHDSWAGKKDGDTSCKIEVFASSNHKAHAEKIRDILIEKDMENDYFKVKIDVK